MGIIIFQWTGQIHLLPFAGLLHELHQIGGKPSATTKDGGDDCEGYLLCSFLPGENVEKE